MSKFVEQETNINGVFAITKKIIGDDHGYLERVFCSNELESWSNRSIAQVNKTVTAKKGTVRGLHFQRPPYAEAKLISCLSGRVKDIALDLRNGSPTYGKIYEIVLDSCEHNAILLPEGVAHGFQSLTDNVVMLYFHSCTYAPNFEGGVNILDSSLELDFELPVSKISERDQNFPSFKELEGLQI